MDRYATKWSDLLKEQFIEDYHNALVLWKITVKDYKSSRVKQYSLYFTVTFLFGKTGFLGLCVIDFHVENVNN